MRAKVGFTTGGLLFGVFLAVFVEQWRQTILEQASAAGAEGAWWDATMGAIVAGFPTNALLALLLEPAAAVAVMLGTDPFYALLFGIVVNWSLIGALIGTMVQRVASRRETAG